MLLSLNFIVAKAPQCTPPNWNEFCKTKWIKQHSCRPHMSYIGLREPYTVSRFPKSLSCHREHNYKLIKRRVALHTISMSTQGGSIVPPTLSEIVFHPRTFTWIWVSNLWMLVGINSIWNSEIQRHGRVLCLTSCSLPFPTNASCIKRRDSLISGHQIKVLKI